MLDKTNPQDAVSDSDSLIEHIEWEWFDNRPPSVIVWFYNRLGEMFQDDELRKSSLITHAKGCEIAAAVEFDEMKQLEYDCCCNAAWEEAKEKWIKNELS